MEEIDSYEQKYGKLAKWYKAWLIANYQRQFNDVSEGFKIDERPPEFVYKALLIRRKILNIINNNI